MYPDDEDALGRFEMILALSAIVRNGTQYGAHPGRFTELVIGERPLFEQLSEGLAACSGVSFDAFIERFEGFCRESELDKGYFDAENMNRLLSLHCGEPVPAFPFIKDGRVDHTMLGLPCDLCVLHLLHASLRGRTRRLMEHQRLAPLGRADHLQRLLSNALPGAWHAECVLRRAAWDFIFWGKNAAEAAKPSHALVVQELRMDWLNYTGSLSPASG